MFFLLVMPLFDDMGPMTIQCSPIGCLCLLSILGIIVLFLLHFFVILMINGRLQKSYEASWSSQKPSEDYDTSIGDQGRGNEMIG